MLPPIREPARAIACVWPVSAPAARTRISALVGERIGAAIGHVRSSGGRRATAVFRPERFRPAASFPRVGAFLVDTAPIRRSEGADGRFSGELGDGWSVVSAFGGASLAATLRAMNAAVDRPEFRLASAHAQFISPVNTGPFAVDVTVLRMGRSVAQAAGELRERGSDQIGIRVSGTWAHPRPDDPVHGTGVEPPVVDDPGSSSLVRLEHEPPWDQFPIHDKFEEWRSPAHHHPGALFIDTASPESVVWTRLTDASHHDDGRFEVAALALLADRAPGPHLGPCLAPIADEIPARPLVTLDMTLRVYAEPASEWLLLHSRVDEAAEGHVATRVDMWDTERRLVATSEQLARWGNTPLPT